MLMNSWQNPVPEIIQRFIKPPDRMNALIEFLTILPEEINNKRLKLGQNRRDQLKGIFSNSSGYIIEFLETSLEHELTNNNNNNNNNNTTEKLQNKLQLIYKCFASWIEEKLIDPQSIVNSKLFSHMFQFLNDSTTGSNLHDIATQCLVNMLLLYPFNVRATDSNKELLVSLKNHIYTLVNAYKRAESNRITEKCEDLCLIFTELCNALSFYFLNDSYPLEDSHLADMNSINLLLMCGQHSGYEVFQKSFVFWFNTSEEIYTNTNSDKLCNKFREFIYPLIDLLCKHCQLEPDHDCVAPSSKSDDFGDFRQKAADLISDIVFIVEANECFQKMYVVLHRSNAAWYEIEAALYVMCAFAKSISQGSEEQSVVQVVQAILNLPEQCHVSVRCTGIRLIGEMCEWLNKHPKFINSALNFVCIGFNNTKLCQVAANTMLSICTQCQQHMVNHLETLINIIISTENIHEMPPEGSMELLKGAVVILCNLPANEITSPLLKLCNIQLDGLKAAIGSTQTSSNQAPNGSSGGPKSLALYWLDRFTAIFRTIKQSKTLNSANQHPCQMVVETVWPALRTCLNKYRFDAKIIESCCRALRFALRCCDKYSHAILSDVVETIVTSYQANHFSCFLYLGSILVDIYGTEDSFKSGLISMMQAFTKEAFDFIIKNCESVENIDELRKHPDTIDDMYRLALRFMQRCPFEFINSPIFSPLMLLAVTSLNLDHRDANLSVTKFLSEFIAISHKPQIKGLNETNHSLISRVLNEIGEKMIQNTIQTTINMTTRDTKDGIADVLTELLLTNRKLVETDLLNVLKSLRKVNEHGVEIVSEEQLVDIHTIIMQSNSSNDIETALFQLEQLYL
jgi:transportin-3